MSYQNNTYYLKALGNYPYNLPEAIENLNYALSYDDTCANSHCLMGKLYMEQLLNYEMAQYHFEQALCTDLHHIDTYYNFIWLSIKLEEYKQAKKLLRFARQIKGIYKPALLYAKANMHEKRGKFNAAKTVLKKAIYLSTYNSECKFFRDELGRIKRKLKK